MHCLHPGLETMSAAAAATACLLFHALLPSLSMKDFRAVLSTQHLLFSVVLSTEDLLAVQMTCQTPPRLAGSG